MRNEGFNEFIPLAPEKKFVLNSNAMFLTYSLGIATNKDVFLYNSSKNQLVSKLNQMVDFYNLERNAKKHDSNYKVKYDSTKIVWTDMFLKSLNNNIPFQVHKELVTESMYRPFFKQYFSYQKELIQRTYQQEKLFPTTETKNYLIALSGISASKPFTSLIVDNIPCLDMVEKGQCFPLYWYEKRETLQLSLFDEEPQAEYVRRDGISNWILNEVRTRLKIKSIDKEMIFYYIYGFLHSPEYRSTFEADLKKSLPRIPIIEDVDAFNDFYQAGKALAKLHLDYENVPAYEDLEIEDTYHGKDVYEHYAVSPKMRFPKKDKKDTIIYNDYITIRHIPAEAYDYIVNGKSAIEWLMERYAITIDKKSGIKNDPNDWSREHENPSYIFDLLCSIVNVSVKTMEIVGKLPKISFNGAEVSIDIAGRMSEISDSAQKELTIATEDNTLYLQVKQEEFYHIVVEEAASLVRPITESTAPRYLAVNAQGVPLYNKQNVKEGVRYYLNDYNAGKFPYALREYRYLKLVNGKATVLIAIRRINLQAENVRGNIAQWNVEFSLGEILKVENYIIK